MTVAAGYFGKLPTRGDFVRSGLPSDFVRALDDWWQAVLSGSRAALGEQWVDVWMEAPIWRFLLPPGVCGAGAVAGLWLPSTDRAGRLFPLTLAIAGRSWRDLAPYGQFLDAAEEVGLEAVGSDVTPEALAASVAAAAQPGQPLMEPAGAVWWTAGSRLVAPGRRVFASMPDVAAFTDMLRDPNPSPIA